MRDEIHATGDFGRGGGTPLRCRSDVGKLCGVVLLALSVANVWASVPHAVAAPPTVRTYRIESLTGDSQPDSVPPLQANVGPQGLGIDSSGRVYTASSTGLFTTLRRFSVDGLMVTLAGNPIPDLREHDGNPAVTSDVQDAEDVAIGPDGCLYFTMPGACVIRKIDVSNRVFTIAGTWFVGTTTGDGGPAKEATITIPTYLIWGSDGSLYFSQNYRVRKIGPDGTIQTVAGGAPRSYDPPCEGCPGTEVYLDVVRGLAVDARGRLYLADESASRVSRVDLDGTIRTYAGTGVRGYTGDGGPATQARLDQPKALAFGSSGNLLISDSTHGVIRSVDSTGVISTIAGTGVRGYSGDNGPARLAQIVELMDIAVDSIGNIYLSHGDRIRRIDTDGRITTVAGTGSISYAGDGGPLKHAAFGGVVYPVASPSGEVFLADVINTRLRRVDASGIVTTFAHMSGWGFSRHPDGDIYYLTGSSQIRRVDGSGQVHDVGGTTGEGYAGDGGPVSMAKFFRANDLYISPSGWIYIADSGNYRVRYVDGNGTVRTLAGDGTSRSAGDGGPAGLASVNDPRGVYATADSVVYIAEGNGHRIRKVDRAGVITTVAGGQGIGFSGDGGPAVLARLNAPNSVCVDRDGYLFIADMGNQRIRCVSPDGIITTIAGNGGSLYNGGGIPALQAALYSPEYLAEGPDGSIYFLAWWRVRRLYPVPNVPAAFGSLHAQLAGSTVVLTWTASSSAAVEFTIERRLTAGGAQFVEVGRLQADGRAEYAFNEMPGGVPVGQALEYRVIVTDSHGRSLAVLGPVRVDDAGAGTRARASIVVMANPFALPGRLIFTLPQPATVSVDVFDLRGRRVAVLARGPYTAGAHEAIWRGTDDRGRPVASGVYLVRLSGGAGIGAEARITVVQ